MYTYSSTHTQIVDDFLAMWPQIGSIAAVRRPEGWMNNDMKVRSLNSFCNDRRSNNNGHGRSGKFISSAHAQAACAGFEFRLYAFGIFPLLDVIAVLKVCTNSVTSVRFARLACALRRDREQVYFLESLFFFVCVVCACARTRAILVPTSLCECVRACFQSMRVQLTNRCWGEIEMASKTN